jgi:putative glutamine amidotransferase
MANKKPLVGVCCDTKTDGPHLYHLAGHKYVNAVAQSAKATPILMPSLANDIDWDELLSQLDGVLLTGSYSNIQPHLYGLDTADPGSFCDELRDASTLPLITKIVDAGIPLLAICRGFQEMNVVYGGTLHRMVHEVEGLNDHREDKSSDVDAQYSASQSIKVSPGGILEKITQGKLRQRVNSIHMQGVRDLGQGLRVEAVADDGLVEAFSVSEAKAFTLAVQWHPEWKTPEHTFYRQIFDAFGDACRQKQQCHSNVVA